MGSLYDDSKVMAKLANLPCKGFVSYADVFEKLCEMSSDGFLKKIYAVLERVCRFSYCLDKPYIYEDVDHKAFEISSDDYKLLADLVADITDPKLKARVADILWISSRKYSKKGEFKFAKIAVDAFSQLPLDAKGWISENLRSDWKRGVCLAKSVKSGVKEEYSRIQDRLEMILSDKDDVLSRDSLVFDIGGMLNDDDLYDVLDPKFVAHQLSSKLEKVCCDRTRCHTIQYYAGLAAEWHKRIGDEESVVKLAKWRVSSFLAEIAQVVSEARPQWLLIARLVQDALKELQGISKCYRENSDYEGKITYLKQVRAIACKLGIARMHSRVTIGEDISIPVENARSKVKGLAFEAAMRQLARFDSILESKVKEKTQERIAADIIPHITSRVVIHGSRVVAQSPAICSSKSRDDIEKSIRFWAEEVKQAIVEIQKVCVSSVVPAYKVVKEEHRDIGLPDFEKMVAASDFVPNTHIKLFSEGLCLGYEGRFTASAYLLTPEIENIMREQLKNIAHDTSSIIPETQLESEYGLSNLIKNHSDAIQSIFGADLLFELRVVFCCHDGPNIRNEIAHGLKDDETFNGVMDFYVWWFAVRLLYMRART